ncbi:MAG: hypothetical protein CL920_14865 [Deltaproteobacteria bacterium]|nr:hypothetical protein [Deltaproteobacteria bacterium]MBU49966.1 hypothetical protein [Deltaproteobacteria bacterium]|tara:strand:- start:75 stop:4106 length:4032 start_codon:yes stop_codon:yes gene_type:complete
MQDQNGLIRRHLILFLIVIAVSGLGSWGVFTLLGFPSDICLAFASIVAAECFLLSVLGTWSSTRVSESIAELRFQNDRLKARMIYTSVAFIIGVLVYTFFVPQHFWWFVLSTTALGVLGFYTLTTLLIAMLLHAEFQGSVKHGFSETSLGRLVATIVISIGIFCMVGGNFLGGIHWWYYTYVTPQVRSKVLKRSHLLKSIELTSLYDGRGKYVGLYTKTESDWSRAYNDPKLLDWKVTQAIALSEGPVEKPAWWWRYLPAGSRLQCEPFSIEAFLRIPYYFIKQRRKVGGSTPALQAAKNFMDFGLKRRNKGFLSTVSMKLFEEMPRAYVMCQLFSPRQMMSIYQATLWAGHKSNYGLHRLSLHFFDKGKLSTLDWNEAAVLAASLPNPYSLNPWYLESCREGKCSSKRRQRVYKVWLKRINHLKNRMRRKGIKVPKELPSFKNGLNKLRAISNKYKAHDTHLRNWVLDGLSDEHKKWTGGSRVFVTYDRELSVGKLSKKPKSIKDVLKWKPTPNDKGLIHIVREYAKLYRQDIENIQISYSLIDARDGKIVSQYGGDSSFDMSLSPKPVVGSVFKVITSLVGSHWPAPLPLVNFGKGYSRKPTCVEKPETCTQRRRFLYHAPKGSSGHWVRNSHKMPTYMSKKQALVESANIAFTYMSLRWTWLIEQDVWKKVLKAGLVQLYQLKRQLSDADVSRKVDDLLNDPKRLRIELIRHFGYQRYLQGLREQAIFEAAKAATIKQLLANTEVDKKQLALFLTTEANTDLSTYAPQIQQTLLAHKDAYTKKFQGPLSFEELTWSRELRMEMGLRYIITLAQKITGFDIKKNNLKPVLTMTLGVNDATTQQLARIPSFIAAQKLVEPYFIRAITRDKKPIYLHKSVPQEPPVPTNAIEDVKQAMRGVLEKGTATQAGRLLKKKYGKEILAEAAAKTGTVQKTRGLSCIGFLGHRAGAVTLSTPNNKRLTVYRLKRSIRRKVALYEKRIDYHKEKLESLKSERSRRRRRQLIERYKRKLEAINKTVTKYAKLRKEYYQRKETIKSNDLRVRRFFAKAKRLYRSARKQRYWARIYLSRSRKARKRSLSYRKLVEIYKQKDQQNRLNQQRLRKYTSLYRRAVRRTQAHYGKYRRYSQSRLRNVKQARQLRQKAYNLRASNNRLKRQHRRLSRAFFRGHQRWSLSSGKACLILFSLLSYWKDHPLPTAPPLHLAAAAPTTEETSEPTTETTPSETTSDDAGVTDEALPTPPVIKTFPTEPEEVKTPEATKADAGAPDTLKIIQLPEKKPAPIVPPTKAPTKRTEPHEDIINSLRSKNDLRDLKKNNSLKLLLNPRKHPPLKIIQPKKKKKDKK